MKFYNLFNRTNFFLNKGESTCYNSFLDCPKQANTGDKIYCSIKSFLKICDKLLTYSIDFNDGMIRKFTRSSQVFQV